MSAYARFCLVAAALALATPRLAPAQLLDAGPQVLTLYSDVDDTEQPYALYLPPRFDAAKRYPMVISLHGAGSNHRLNLRRVFGKSNADGENDVEASRYFPEWNDVEYIVASPYARGTMGYQGVAEQDVLDVLADVRRRFPIDDNRVYLTGLSMGGGGTLWLGLTRPDVWAAIAPVCPAPPPGAAALAPNALNLSVLVAQGAADPVVHPESVRTWVRLLERHGADVKYEEYPGVGHDSWVQAYADGRIFDWFARFKRNPHPDRVHFVSDRHKYDTAYWVRLDALTPGTLARIDARFVRSNHLAVQTAELDGFTLHLAGHPRFAARDPLIVEVDGTRLETRTADSVSFSRPAGTWIARRAATRGKHAGLEGPMSEVIAGRHVYVYGTAGDPSPEALAARRAQAVKAAEWSVYRGEFWGRVMVFPRVVADRDVRPSDLESANLVLFGTRETNGIIARFGDRLPVHLDGASQAHGLVYVYPIEDRYVLVNSGLPWWQAAAASPRSPFTADVPAFALMGLEDYLLFEGSSDNVIAAGRFDNEWRLPLADTERMRNTGAVLVTQGTGTIRSSLRTVDVRSGRIETVYAEDRHFEAPNWSPDGRFFVVNSDGRLYRLPARGDRRLEEIPTGFATRVNNDHGISPDGASIVLSHAADEHIADPAQAWLASSIYVMPVGGSAAPAKVTSKAPSFWHGWSPDGSTLAYVGLRDGEWDIFTIPVGGGEERRLTTCRGLDDGPDYTPDGRFVYYNSFCSGKMEIWRMRTDGSRPEQLTSDAYSNWFPHPSPDGRWVVFLAYLEDQGESHPFGRHVKLRLMDRRDGSVRDLTPLFFGGQGTLNVPSWSPNSRRVAFVSYEQR